MPKLCQNHQLTPAAAPHHQNRCWCRREIGGQGGLLKVEESGALVPVGAIVRRPVISPVGEGRCVSGVSDAKRATNETIPSAGEEVRQTQRGPLSWTTEAARKLGRINHAERLAGQRDRRPHFNDSMPPKRPTARCPHHLSIAAESRRRRGAGGTCEVIRRRNTGSSWAMEEDDGVGRSPSHRGQRQIWATHGRTEIDVERRHHGNATEGRCRA